ncbi:hypothetical protein GCM10010869_16490 [Mesorhizobium tianshanense]|nr:hypothetical protein GCM10010869_16490 [Mesorhizobium tianshanense]
MVAAIAGSVANLPWVCSVPTATLAPAIDVLGDWRWGSFALGQFLGRSQKFGSDALLYYDWHNLAKCPRRSHLGAVELLKDSVMLLEDITHWLGRDGNGLAAAQVVAAFVTALATLALWRVTKVLAVETAALAKMTSRPFVVCSLESSGASAIALNLTLRNTGNATAFDVKLQVTPALPKPDGSQASDQVETNFETSLLPPGQMLPIQGVMGPKVHDKRFKATISWAALPDAKERDTLSYNFEPKDGFRGGWSTKGAHHIAEELEKIRKEIPRRRQ